jgi:hypothetical protein
MKLRIIKHIYNIDGFIRDSNNYSVKYLIQKKTLFGWKNVTTDELNTSKKVAFNTYEEAESYMFKTYFIDGNVTQSNNVYVNTKYYYYV